MSALSTAPVYFYKFSFDGELGLFKRLLGLQEFKGNTVLWISVHKLLLNIFSLLQDFPIEDNF
jgi:hypothetical protein